MLFPLLEERRCSFVQKASSSSALSSFTNMNISLVWMCSVLAIVCSCLPVCRFAQQIVLAPFFRLTKAFLRSRCTSGANHKRASSNFVFQYSPLMTAAQQGCFEQAGAIVSSLLSLPATVTVSVAVTWSDTLPSSVRELFSFVHSFVGRSPFELRAKQLFSVAGFAFLCLSLMYCVHFLIHMVARVVEYFLDLSRRFTSEHRHSFA